MFGCAGSLLLPGFSAAAESRGCSGPGCECLTAVPSLVAEGGLWGARAAVAVAPGVREWKSESLSCVQLWDPVDYTARGIFQGRILEWIAVPFSRGSSQPRDWTHISYIPCTTNSYVLKCLVNKITSISVTFRETWYIYHKIWTWCVLALAFLGGVGEGASSARTGRKGVSSWGRKRNLIGNCSFHQRCSGALWGYFPLPEWQLYWCTK